MLVKPDLLVFVLLEAENLPSLPILLSSPNIGYQLHKVDLATRVGGNEGRLGFERLLPREEIDTNNFSFYVELLLLAVDRSPLQLFLLG